MLVSPAGDDVIAQQASNAKETRNHRKQPLHCLILDHAATLPTDEFAGPEPKPRARARPTARQRL